MPDNEPNPVNQPNGAEPANEAEVDRILAEAAGLADDLEGQIGDDGGALSADTESPISAEDDAPVNVDSQLDHVERLLRGLKKEADIAPPQPETTEPAADAVQDEQPLVPDDIPPLKDPSASDDPPPDEADQDAPPPGDLPTDTSAKSQGSPADFLEGLDEDLAAAVLPDLADPSETSDPSSQRRRAASPASMTDVSADGDSSPRRRILGGHGAAAQIAVVAIERSLAVLDALDRMFAWISYDSRRVIGWVALALFVAACAIMAFSFS